MKYPANLDKWIVHFVKDELTKEESIALREWRNASVENETLFRKLISEENYRREVSRMALWESEEAWKQVKKESCPEKWDTNSAPSGSSGSGDPGDRTERLVLGEIRDRKNRNGTE